MRVEKRAIVGNIVMLQISKTKCLPLTKLSMDTIGLSKIEISDETKNSCSCDDLCINTGTSECAGCGSLRWEVGVCGREWVYAMGTGCLR